MADAWAAGRAARQRLGERVLRDWGIELPESSFRFLAFLDALGPEEQRAFTDDLWLSPLGVTDLAANPRLAARDGIDVRVHGRSYRDPPEFLSFLHGGSDGLHFGLWSDDGRTCQGVASYWTNDGGGIDTAHRTPLEAVRGVLELVWRDLDDYGEEGAGAHARRARLSALREVLISVETGERTGTGAAYTRAHGARRAAGPERITTFDGAGARVRGATTLDRPAQGPADEYRLTQYLREQFADPRRGTGRMGRRRPAAPCGRRSRRGARPRP